MMPVGAPTKSFSARWVARTISSSSSPAPGQFVEGGDDGALNGVGRGEPGAQGDVGIQQQVQAGHLDAALLQRPDDAERVLGPALGPPAVQAAVSAVVMPWSP